MDLLIIPHAAHLLFQHGFVACEAWVLHKTLHAVEKLGAKISDRDRAMLRQGFGHLVAAQSASAKKSRSTELKEAHRCFARVRELARGSRVPEMAALAQFGDYLYFDAREDRRNSLRCVYDCAVEYPDLALAIFPQNFFSCDYARLKAEAKAKLTSLKNDLALAEIAIQEGRQRSATPIIFGFNRRNTLAADGQAAR